MDLNTFSDELDYLSKSESEMFHDFIVSEDSSVRFNRFTGTEIGLSEK